VAGIALAWLVGEALIVYRSVSKQKRPPAPGALLGSAGFFALCALVAEAPGARPAATMAAWAIVIAAYLNAPIITPASTTAASTGSSSSAPVGAGQGAGTRNITNT
jgi:hypothetical protein